MSLNQRLFALTAAFLIGGSASPPPDMNKGTLAGGHHRLGTILEKQGKKDQARAENNMALSIDPTNENAKKSLAALK